MQTHNDQKDYSYFLAEVMNADAGISVLTDPDKTIYDALKIADHLMYEDKFNNKQVKIEGRSD